MTLSIGKPVCIFKSERTGRTYIQLSYLKNGERMNLWNGHHPHIELGPSRLRFALEYQSGAAAADPADMLKATIETEFERRLRRRTLVISQGESAGKAGYSFIKVEHAHLIRGLVIDPRAVAADSCFR